MANAKKTIIYSTPNFTTTVVDATVTNLPQITLYIPETVISFNSVYVDVAFQDIITATGGTIASHRCGLRLGAAAYSTVTDSNVITNTGENIAGVIGPFDFTSHFTTNWTGTNMTCDIQVYFDQNSGTTLGMMNTSATVYITYTYDDAPATNGTQIKTVAIPLESLVGTLSTTANSNIGTNQIPILTGGASPTLPEASIVIRDYFFFLEGNTSNNASATDFTVTFNIDSGTSTASGNIECALGTDTFMRLVYKPSAVPSTTVVHNFQCWASRTNSFNHTSFTLYITYEFNANTTTRLLNSIYLPINFEAPLGFTTTAEASRLVKEIIISEPGTLELKQSAFRINFGTSSSITALNFRAGSQAYRTYTNIANTTGGMYSLQQRIDSGSALGAGFTLAKGKNTLTIDSYTTDSTDEAAFPGGYVLLNYTSDIPSGGIGAAHHSVFEVMYQWNALLQDNIRMNNYSVSIPLTNYYLSGVAFIMYHWNSASTSGFNLNVECLTSENKQLGYYNIFSEIYRMDTELGSNIFWVGDKNVFRKYPTDPLERIPINTARDYVYYTSSISSTGFLSMLTYHGITYSSTLTIAGSAGGTVNIKVYRADTNELILSTSRVGNGDVTLTWYDDTINVYADCYESNTHLGRSAIFNFGD